MKRFETESLGEIPLLVVKGAIAEFEYFFNKQVLVSISEGWTTKNWIVMAFESYKAACHREKIRPVCTLSNFQYDLKDEELAEMVKYIDAELDSVLGITKLLEALKEPKKKK